MHTVEYFKGNSMSTVTVSCTLSSSVRHSKRLYPNPCDTTQLLPNAGKRLSLLSRSISNRIKNSPLVSNNASFDHGVIRSILAFPHHV